MTTEPIKIASHRRLIACLHSSLELRVPVHNPESSSKRRRGPSRLLIAASSTFHLRPLGWDGPTTSSDSERQIIPAAGEKGDPDGRRGRLPLYDGRLRAMVSRHDAVLDDSRAVPAPPPHPENAPVDRRARARAARARRGALRDRSRGAWCLGAIPDPEDSATRARGVAVLGEPRGGGSASGACLDAVAVQRGVGALAVPHPV